MSLTFFLGATDLATDEPPSYSSVFPSAPPLADPGAFPWTQSPPSDLSGPTPASAPPLPPPYSAVGGENPPSYPSAPPPPSPRNRKNLSATSSPPIGPEESLDPTDHGVTPRYGWVTSDNDDLLDVNSSKEVFV